jgi:hypothetical protein
MEKVNQVLLHYLIYGGIRVVSCFYQNDQIISFFLEALFAMLPGYFGVKQAGIFTQSQSSYLIDLVSHQETRRETMTAFLK